MSNDPLKTLNDQIMAAKSHTRRQIPSTLNSSDRTGTGLSSGMRAGTEFIGGIIGGILFGACADWMFDITPFGLITGVILGVTAGFYGVYRSTK